MTKFAPSMFALLRVSTFALIVPAFSLAGQLHLLVATNDILQVEKYLKSSFGRASTQINAPDCQSGLTPMDIAIRLGNIQMQELLWQFGARPTEMEAGSPHRKYSGHSCLPIRRSPLTTSSETIEASSSSFGVRSSPVAISQVSDDDEAGDLFKCDREQDYSDNDEVNDCEDSPAPSRFGVPFEGIFFFEPENF